MIAIADYGMGNLQSVSKAFERIGATVFITNSPEEILKSNALVIPGVGAFGDCIQNLKKIGLIEAIKKFISTGKPYLGLCLGMQILFDKSEEAPGVKALGIFSGTVKKFSSSMGLKIPHMGWNTLQVSSLKSQVSSDLFKGVPNMSYMYFVHSYYAEPEDKSIIACETKYGIEFCSAIRKDNISATQFHPEKSQKLGLKILKNFIGLCK